MISLFEIWKKKIKFNQFLIKLIKIFNLNRRQAHNATKGGISR